MLYVWKDGGVSDPALCASDLIDQLSLEPYADLSLAPLDWVREVTAATDVPVVAMVRAHADGA